MLVLQTLYILPPVFWVVQILLIGGVFWAVKQIRSGLGLPVLVVLATVASWYVIDVLYNDYLHTYAMEFSSASRDEAWWQIALFLLVFLFLATPVHQLINQRSLRRSSQVLLLAKEGCDKPHIQWGLTRLLQACLIAWALLSLVAAFRLQGAVLYYFCPYLSYLADPWARDRIGAGFDYLLAVALHLHMFLAAMFGIVLAVMKNPKLRALALFGVLTSWPYLIFGRTRNFMLAAVIPGVLVWVFLRLRAHIAVKIVVLVVLFSLVSAWFNFVMIHRDEDSIAAVFSQEGFNLEGHTNVHQEGLNMFGELCWINTFIDQGIYKPNGGKRYWAEIVNPIPRSIWPGKPLIGIDYAILRGQGWEEQDASGAGVGATIATGLIGQGVVNYGQVFGPAFAAFLMCLWVAVLARLDLYGDSLGRIPLYSLGLILTFNLGRDITLLTLYTFIFGAMIVWMVEQMGLGKFSYAKTVPRSRARGMAPVPSVIFNGASLDSSPSDQGNHAPHSSSSARAD